MYFLVKQHCILIINVCDFSAIFTENFYLNMKSISIIKRCLGFILSFSLFTSLSAQELIPTKKLTSSDREEGDCFSWSISSDGDYMLIGAYSEYDIAVPPTLNTYAGAVYAFKKDSNGNWKETQKLMASDRRLGAQFGFSVDIYGDYAVIGANEDGWSGAFYDDFGSAYIFKRNAAGVWQEIQKIENPDSSHYGRFGESVAIHKDNIVIGCSRCYVDTGGAYSLSNAGVAFFYKLNSNGLWSLSSRVTASNIESSAEFGIDVDLIDSTAIIGAWGDSKNQNNQNSISDAGAAYIFKQSPNGHWNETQKVVASNRSQYAEYGYSVSIDENFALVGSPGKSIPGKGRVGMAYILQQDSLGLWQEIDNWYDQTANYGSVFGFSVSLKGSNAIIGAPGMDFQNKDYGAAYHYRLDSVSKNWLLVDQIFATDKQDGDNFGTTVTMDNGAAYVGTYLHELDSLGQNPLGFAGAVYCYDFGCIKDSIDLALNGKYLSAQPKTNGKWVWINCDSNSIVPNPPIDSIKIIANGNYRAIFINNSGCIDSSACFTVNDVGIREAETQLSPEVYPNPFHSATNVKLSEFHQNPIIIVRDATGKEIIRIATDGAKQLTLPLQNFPEGIYFLTIASEDSITTHKIIKL